MTIQAQIIELVKELRDKLGMAVIWITHDLGIIAGMAERIMVMYAGFAVEKGSVRDLYADPRHPYTIGLLGSLPRIDGRHSRRLTSIEGRPPDLLQEPQYCPFSPRCPYVIETCWGENPELRETGYQHGAACWVDVKEANLVKAAAGND